MNLRVFWAYPETVECKHSWQKITKKNLKKHTTPSCEEVRRVYSFGFIEDHFSLFAMISLKIVNIKGKRKRKLHFYCGLKYIK